MASHLIASSHTRLVLGLGDSGRSVLRFLQREGALCVAADSNAALANDPALIAELGDIRHQFGDLDASLLDGISEVIAAPGVPLQHPLLVAAGERGIPVRGDIDLFVEQARAPVVGITGSNGKSTVTALLGHLLAAAGYRVAVGGNLGRPALDLLDDAPDVFVLELSSFQLERAGPLNLAAAAVLNVTPDHLDRHGNMAVYQQAKHRIFAGAACAVLNRTDPLTVPLLPASTPVIGWRLDEPDLREFGLRDWQGTTYFCREFERLAPRDAFPLAGRHNAANALAALALGTALGAEPSALAAGLAGFRGLPHRCDVVASAEGVRFIDDSKATNVGATLAAIDGLAAEGPLVLIAGGQGKGQSFASLGAMVARSCRGVVLMGEAAEEIARVLPDAMPVLRVGSMIDAVARATELAVPGCTVLLSPACASFDMFDGYSDRGRQFAAAVLNQCGGAV